MNKDVKSFFDRLVVQPTKVSGLVQHVTTDSTTGRQTKAIITVGGQSVQIKLGLEAPQLALGDSIRLVQVGNAASAEYAIDGINSGARPSSGAFTVLDDGTILNNQSYLGGDVIIGKIDGGNVFIEYDTGRLYHRISTGVYGIEYPDGSQLFGHATKQLGGDWVPDGPNVYITSTAVKLRTAETDSITLDTNGNVWASKKLVAGSGNTIVALDAADATYRIYAGNATPASAPFRVDKTGAVTATSGTIGGWTLGASALTADSGKASIGAGASPSISLGELTGYLKAGEEAKAGVWIGKDGSVYKLFMGQLSTDNYVQFDGANLTIKGEVIATSSQIAGTKADAFTINSDLGAVTSSLVLGRSAGNATLSWNGSNVGLDRFLAISHGATINEGAADADFRVESMSLTHMLFVDASANKVGIGTDTPVGSRLHVSASTSAPTSAMYSSSDTLLVTGGFQVARFVTASSTATESSNLVLLRARGTLAAPTSALLDDSLGSLIWQSLDGGANRQSAGEIEVEMDGTAGASMPGRMIFRTAATDRMTIKSDGKIGINTGAPGALLHLLAGGSAGTPAIGTTTVAVFQRSTGTTTNSIASIISGNAATLSGLSIGDTDDEYAAGVFYNHATNLMSLRTAGADRLYVNSVGHVGIGTDSPIMRQNWGAPWLTIKSNAPGIALQDADNANSVRYIAADAGVMTLGKMNDDGTGATNDVRILADGKVGIGVVTPGYALEVNGTAQATTLTATQGLSAAAANFSVLYHSSAPAHAHLTINEAFDEQFTLNVGGNMRASGYIVGKHAMQVNGAVMVAHFDGSMSYATDYTGSATGHMGQIGTLAGGAIFRPGVFNKGLQADYAVTNLAANPSWETATTGWTKAGTLDTYERVSTDAVYGTYCGHLSDAAGGANKYIASDKLAGIVAGTTYTLTVYAKSNRQGGSMNITWYTAGNTVISTSTATFFTTASVGTWARQVHTAVAPALATQAAINIGLDNVVGSAQTDLYVDAVQLEATGYATGYCDGSLGAGHTWSGTAHASSSARTAGYATYDSSIVPLAAGTIICSYIPYNSQATSQYRGIFNIGSDGAGNVAGTLQVFIFNSNLLYMRVVQGDTTQKRALDGYALTYSTGDVLTFAITWDQAGSLSAYVYKNRVKVTSGSLAITSPWTAWASGGFKVGRGYITASANGIVDELAVLNRVATETEIQAIVESNAPVFAETATFGFVNAPNNRITADETGLWVVDASGNAVLGVAAAAKTWGSVALDPGDLLIGNSGNYVKWDTSANTLSISGTVTATTGTIGGWSLGVNPNGSSQLSATGINIVSGTNPFLAFGATPPNAYNSGTGIFLDPTGLYGLNANTQNFKITTTGALAGSVYLDSRGVSIVNTDNVLGASVKFFNSAYVGSDTNLIGQIAAGTATGTKWRNLEISTGGATADLMNSSARLLSVAYNSGGTLGTAETLLQSTSGGSYVSLLLQATGAGSSTQIGGGGPLITTGDVDIVSDAKKLILGAGYDMSVYYNGTDGYISTNLIADSDLHIACGTDKTLVLDEPVYDDLQFPVSGGRLPGANYPTWETFTTNTSEFAFSINDYIDLQASEPPHGWKEGVNSEVHLHFALKTAQNTGANRYAKFTVYIALADVNGTWAEPTALTAEATIATGSAALKMILLDMGDVTLTGYHIGMQIKMRVKRIAATGGTDYADDVYITQIGMHMPITRLGSRQEYVA